MKLFINHPFHYEAENLTRLFFPLEKITVIKLNFGEALTASPENENYIYSTLNEVNGEYKVRAYVNINGKELTAERDVQRQIASGFFLSAEKGSALRDEAEMQMAEVLFKALSEITGYTPPWGMLTGVRPSKLMRSLLNEMGEGAVDYFKNKLFVSDKKTRLLYSIVKRQQGIIDLSVPSSYSLYVSIPFCPTRCEYCSFVSHSITSFKKKIPEYIELLIKELELISSVAKDLGLRLETVYFGGGTPTSLNESELYTLADAVARLFPLDSVMEYTIEAGRPDTLNEEKLNIMKAAGVSRISINPQTFSDEVLKGIGRCHTAQQTVDAFYMARQAGFDNINMDLITNLPYDTPDGFMDSLNKTLELDPESITVHSLALKRSSALAAAVRNKQEWEAPVYENAYAALENKGYLPYYLYRQSKSAGNRENTGFSKKGFESAYNIYMMEETHTVLAAGAGGVSRLKEPNGEFIDRIFNYKYPYEYISGFEEILERKKGIKTFYEKYPHCN